MRAPLVGSAVEPVAPVVEPESPADDHPDSVDGSVDNGDIYDDILSNIQGSSASPATTVKVVADLNIDDLLDL